MEQVISAVQNLHHTVTPSLRGLLLVVVPGVLSVTTGEAASFLDLHWWGMIQWLLSICVAIYGMYDFHLKIRYMHRGERQYRDSMKKNAEKQKNDECDGK